MNRFLEVELEDEFYDLIMAALDYMNGVVNVVDMEPYVPPVRSK